MFMKRFLMLLVLIVSILFRTNIVNAQKQIGVLFYGPDAISNNSELLDKLDDRIYKLFPTDKFTVVPVREMMAKEEEYRKNKRIFKAPNQITPMPLSNDALCDLGKETGCNYLLSINSEFKTGVRKFVLTLSQAPQKKIDMFTNVMVTDVETNGIIFAKDYQSRSSMKHNSSDIDKAIVKAFRSFVNDFNIVLGKDISFN